MLVCVSRVRSLSAWVLYAMPSQVVSRRSLEGMPSREEVFCRTEEGVVVQNTCLVGDGRERMAVNGLWLPVGLPGPGAVGGIPPHVWQTHRSQAYVDSVPRLRRAQRSWREVPGLDYTFCDDATRDTMVREFSPRLYKVYRLLPLEVMKADVWRYVVLYVRGGVYADVDTYSLSDPSVLWRPRSWLVVAPENCQTNYFCQWVFAAPEGSPIIGFVLQEMMRRLEAEGQIDPASFVEDPHLVHRLTGPAMFTDAVRSFWFRKGLPYLGQISSYARYPAHLMHVLGASFHRKVVHHISLGASSLSGWQAERDKLVIRGGGSHPRPFKRLN